jgi:hypothetical protein
MHGHDVTIYDAKPKGGGLNEYGIAYYKSVGNFAGASSTGCSRSAASRWQPARLWAATSRLTA